MVSVQCIRTPHNSGGLSSASLSGESARLANRTCAPQATPSTYKPSPLGYGTPRSSPFRRTESSTSPSPNLQTTPTVSPTKSGASFAPNRLAPTDTPESFTPRAYTQPHGTTMRSVSPRLGTPAHIPGSRPLPARVQPSGGNALSQLQPAQVRTLRDAFQILDRDSDGVVNREDVADMLGQLGMEHASPTHYARLPFLSFRLPPCTSSPLRPRTAAYEADHP